MAQSVTPESLIALYGEDIAFVAEEEPATSVSDFVGQLQIAAERLEDGGCVGAEEIGPAATYLVDAEHVQPQDRQALLNRAAERLRLVDEAVEEYRLML
jgi:hypothetical protein